jgi:protoporphyrinogen oxidase
VRQPAAAAAFVVIGAGPAGLTAALEASQRGKRPIVIERLRQVGGLARTCEYKGYRFDLGGHRFYTKVPEIDRLWRETLGADFLRRPRLSRILYQDRYFQYPPQILDVLRGLGAAESLQVGLSWAKAQVLPHRPEETFAQWVRNRFGQRFFEMFFRAYTEKVWGISCDELRAEWAAQRIKDVSLPKVMANALGRGGQAKSLITEFDYPRLGPGMMWEAFAERVRGSGGEVRGGTEVMGIERESSRIGAVQLQCGRDRERLTVDHLVSSMPLPDLVRRLIPPPPRELLEAARILKHRAFLIVCLILRRRHVFPDNWIYVQEPRVQVARIQNFKNWSADMVPSDETTSLGLEYFCNQGDELWTKGDAELISLATDELGVIRLAQPGEVIDGRVERVPDAYPIYDASYARSLSIVRAYVDSLENVVTVGRNGLHRYNNQDHSMVTASLGVRRLLDGERSDLWSVNADAEYLEEVMAGDA